MAISKRKKSSIWQISFVGPDGKRVRVSSGATSKTEAKELHDRMKSDSWRQAKLGEKPRKSWQDAVNRFVGETTHKRSHKTDLSRLKWLDTFMGELHLDEITPDVMQSIVEAKREEGNRPETINHTLGLVKNICNRAKEWGWTDTTPHIKKLPVNNERTRVLSEDEEIRLLRALPAHLRDIVCFALATALRRGNVLGLRWEHVDFDREVLTIPGSEMKAGLALGIPLNSTAMSILRRNRGHPTHVFTYEDRPINRPSHATWQRSLRRAKIEDLTFHDLRRTAATRWAIAGVPLDAIMRLGGWSDYSVLLKRYAHLQPEHLRQHAESVSKPLVAEVQI